MTAIVDRRENAIRTRHRPAVPGAPFIPDLERAVAGGVATLDEVSVLVPDNQLATGSAAAGKALMGDRTWTAVATPADVAAETAARIAADAAEAGARAAADTTLQTNITAEATTRATNDATEAATRAAADALLQPLSGKNAVSGYAGLDASSKLTGSQQKYGTAANTACEGNDSRLSDSRAPTGAAGGDLGGTYPNPTLVTYGTYAAAITCGTSGTVTLNASFQTLSYTKIGKQVHVEGLLIISSVSAPVGELRISMPFQADNASQFHAPAALYIDGAKATFTGAPIGLVGANLSYLAVYEFAAGTIGDTAAKVQASTQIRLSVTYQTV